MALFKSFVLTLFLPTFLADELEVDNLAQQVCCYSDTVKYVQYYFFLSHNVISAMVKKNSMQTVIIQLKLANNFLLKDMSTVFENSSKRKMFRLDG